ncbi:hypothetical protein SAMN04487950_1027 [Halogranum rubrum]|uniref:Uncharacterized protein n=1 Tax=Halogranum rubrum TaxID=553466 RepID=A0A1I4C8B5_9EURY|nr:hypothetical protein [Halogranum rubrum]SFK77394.1 hypothetical protein SAMN04487950_1027 [Halogranum rubrum]
MPSRRKVLAAVGSAAVAGMAGCSGSGSGGSDTVDCHTSALARGDGDILDNGARGTVEDGNVRLAVPLSVDDVRENDVDRLEVYDAADELAYTIPVSADDAGVMANKVGVNEGQLLYEQSLGHRPFHGRYRIVALNTSDETVDFVTVEFNCFSDVSD